MKTRIYTKVPFISDGLHEQLWGEPCEEPPHSVQLLKRAKLERAGVADLEPVELPVELPYAPWLPPASALLKKAAYFVASEVEEAIRKLAHRKVPKPPKSVPWVTGWRNNKSGKWVACDQPHGRLLVWDCEAVKFSDKDEPLRMAPVTACALDAEGFYWIWCNNLGPDPSDLETLIPCGVNAYIIHNANFDRSLMSCAYEKEDRSSYFCTMSVAIAARGVPNKHIPDLIKAKKEGLHRDWKVDQACEAGLDDLVQFYLHEPLDKGTRGRLWKEGLSFVRSNTWEVNYYCLKDVETTARLLPFLIRDYDDQFGNSEYGTLVTTAGNMAVSRQRLPMSDQSLSFYERTDKMYKETLEAISEALRMRAKEVHESMLSKDPSDWDPWEQQLATLPVGKDSKKRQQYGSELMKSGKNKGLMRWYAKVQGTPTLTLHQRTSPLLLKLVKVEGVHRYPFVYQFIDKLETDGWTANGEPLAHPDHRDKAVKDLFINGLYWHYETGAISSSHQDVVNRVLPLANSIQHFTMFRKRYQDVRLYEGDDGYYFIPPIVQMGASSNRTTCPITLVSWQATKNQIGTSFQSLVDLRDRGTDDPETLLSMDYDGQEARCGGYFANKKEPALSDEFLLSMLVGDKKTGTDLHSLIATKLFGTIKERATAKTLFYACMYGQGISGATEYIMTSNPELSKEEAEKLAKAFQEELKGVQETDPRETRPGRKIRGGGRQRRRMTYKGGRASDVFNAIEDFSEEYTPYTPLFGDRIAFPMRGTAEFKTTRDNGIIQQTGRGLLNITMTVFDYLLTLAGIPHQIILSIHDCVKYRVSSQYQERAAFLLAITHKVAYVLLAQSLAIDTLPLPGLYPESIELDFMWRKSPHKGCKTPETPEGFPPGREVTPHYLYDRLMGDGLDGCPEFTKWWLSNQMDLSIPRRSILS